MKYISGWEETAERLRGFWTREETDRCCVSMTAPVDPNGVTGCPNFYFDTEFADRTSRQAFGNLRFFGEAFPCVFPYFGTAGIAEYAGCTPHYAPDTVWLDPYLPAPDAGLISYRKPEAFECQLSAVKDLVSRANGEHFVSVTDNCGILDALSQLRGTENLLTDLIEEPEFVEEALKKLTAIYLDTQGKFFDAVKENNLGGSVHSWMGLWSPGRCAQLQCDFSVMISPAMYERFVLPELFTLTKWLTNSVYHLDGQEQARHLDHILSVKELNAIQWTHVEGQPSPVRFIPELRRIQQAGKGIVICVDPDEVAPLLQGLSCRGLMLVIGGIRTPEEGERMMELVRRESRA